MADKNYAKSPTGLIRSSSTTAGFPLPRLDSLYHGRPAPVNEHSITHSQLSTSRIMCHGQHSSKDTNTDTNTNDNNSSSSNNNKQNNTKYPLFLYKPHRNHFTALFPRPLSEPVPEENF